MDRLTKRTENGEAWYNRTPNKEVTNSDLLDRLAAYEDTGLTPEVCQNYKIFEDEAIKNGVSFKRIVELMNAEAEGSLIVLPCKLGGVIYRAINSRPIKGDKPWQYIKQSRLSWNNLQGILRDFEKTVFLTREEAEAALKGESK